MFDLQSIINNQMVARRAKEMSTSEQLTLGELILKLEAIEDKSLPIVFDNGEYKPTTFNSWRGSYDELAISYDPEETGSYNSDEIEEQFDDMTFYKQKEIKLSNIPTVKEFLSLAKECMGKTFTGYKGGDFLMGKTTPIWVANYGDSSGYIQETQGVVDILNIENKVVSIITKSINY